MRNEGSRDGSGTGFSPAAKVGIGLGVGFGLIIGEAAFLASTPVVGPLGVVGAVGLAAVVGTLGVVGISTSSSPGVPGSGLSSSTSTSVAVQEGSSYRLSRTASPVQIADRFVRAIPARKTSEASYQTAVRHLEPLAADIADRSEAEQRRVAVALYARLSAADRQVLGSLLRSRSVQAIAKKLMKEGESTSAAQHRAFAIATSNLQRHGYLASGSVQITQKGLVSVFAKLASPDAGAKRGEYRQLLANGRSARRSGEKSERPARKSRKPAAPKKSRRSRRSLRPLRKAG